MRAGVDLPAPPRALPRDEGGSGWIRLTRATGDIDAHLLSGRLTEAGIETWLVKDRDAPGAWLYGGSNPWAPVTVMVRRIQLDEARLVLAEIAYEAPAVDRAPSASPAPAPVVWWAVAVGLGVLFTVIGLARTTQLMESNRSCAAPVICPTAP